MSSTLSISDYDAVGFDIDHTLAKYNLPNLFNLIYDALATYLVKERGYDEDLLKPFDKDFCTRGLVYDVQKGHFLKLAEDGTILRASHGTIMMTDEEIIAEFGESRHWPRFEELIENVNNIKEDFRIFENFFDMPGAVMIARMVDVTDKKEAGKRLTDYRHLWPDMFSAFQHVYLHTQFKDDAGGYFNVWKKDIGKYVEQCSAMLLEWLLKLKETGKIVFVLTSSYCDFATASLRHILKTDDLGKFIDVFLTFARKPSFFKHDRQFLNVEDFTETDPAEAIREGVLYSQGSSCQFMKYLKQKTNKTEPKVLFFGDSIRSDVYPSKKFENWDTFLVLEEMEAEQYLIGGDEDQPPKRKRRRTMEPLDLEKEYLTSRQWGSLFTDDHFPNNRKNNGKKYMNTLWGYIIRKYADVAVPQLEHITDLPLDFEFTRFNHLEPRQWGFYPSVPSALKDETPSESVPATS